MQFNTDFTKILRKEHEGKWVALSDDGKKVVAFAETLLELKEKVGNQTVTYMKVPFFDVSYAF